MKGVKELFTFVFREEMIVELLQEIVNEVYRILSEKKEKQFL